MTLTAHFNWPSGTTFARTRPLRRTHRRIPSPLKSVGGVTKSTTYRQLCEQNRLRKSGVFPPGMHNPVAPSICLLRNLTLSLSDCNVTIRCISRRNVSSPARYIPPRGDSNLQLHAAAAWPYMIALSTSEAVLRCNPESRLAASLEITAAEHQSPAPALSRRLGTAKGSTERHFVLLQLSRLDRYRSPSWPRVSIISRGSCCSSVLSPRVTIS